MSNMTNVAHFAIFHTIIQGILEFTALILIQFLKKSELMPQLLLSLQG